MSAMHTNTKAAAFICGIYDIYCAQVVYVVGSIPAAALTRVWQFSHIVRAWS